MGGMSSSSVFQVCVFMCLLSIGSLRKRWERGKGFTASALNAPRAVGRAQYGRERQVGRVSLRLAKEPGAEVGTSQKSRGLRGSLQRNSPLLGTSQQEYDTYGFIQFSVSLLI